MPFAKKPELDLSNFPPHEVLIEFWMGTDGMQHMDVSLSGSARRFVAKRARKAGQSMDDYMRDRLRPAFPTATFAPHS